ncbi:MAG: hypothetical protein HY518_01060 [Candidatus Aenigmarchaeota archaeon]|nr:hypothetical protein [Candidatus Aenigmarchaeota archaeon]
MEFSRYELAVLKALHSRRVYGKHHKSFDTIVRSCSVGAHELGNVKGALHSLIRKGLVIWYDKGRKALQLNKKRSKEIMEIISNSLQ